MQKCDAVKAKSFRNLLSLLTQQCYMNSHDNVAKEYTRLELWAAAAKSFRRKCIQAPTLYTENGRCLSQWNTFPRDMRHKQLNLWLLREIWSQPGTDQWGQGWWGRGKLSGHAQHQAWTCTAPGLIIRFSSWFSWNIDDTSSRLCILVSVLVILGSQSSISSLI